ncbi:ABC-type transport auxiliary lipoprotein family protein [Massilia endophytica]|uniref:ABC-type transport auxiliary lipoprotein family protein n=1 Tax=Massilia endophytica TaxID=2899220 RepID=UPI001E42EBA2|nr:ABC-type transport auxiliary lipoprotein family protein [Massilia endophytica]UGQ46061.1 PqiC family protein [Massilia endophytica]
MTTLMLRSLSLLACAALFAGCAATKGPASTTFDFGPLTAPAAAAAPANYPVIVVSDVTGPAVLDTQRMYYRLMYADAQQSRPYAYNQWAANPMQLLTQRLKARMAQAGVKVLNTTDASGGTPLLRLEADEFSQNFDSQTASSASITLRASIFKAHKLIDQRTFSRHTPAPSADAPGGARALAATADAIAADLLAWLATLPAQPQ